MREPATVIGGDRLCSAKEVSLVTATRKRRDSVFLEAQLKVVNDEVQRTVRLDTTLERYLPEHAKREVRSVLEPS